jgi:hypothetical protein
MKTEKIKKPKKPKKVKQDKKFERWLSRINDPTKMSLPKSTPEEILDESAEPVFLRRKMN